MNQPHPATDAFAAAQRYLPESAPPVDAKGTPSSNLSRCPAGLSRPSSGSMETSAAPVPQTTEAGRRAVVTGACGFIGSHLVDRLLSQGWKVEAIDNFDPFYSRAIKDSNCHAHRSYPGYRLHEGDIGDAAVLDAAMNHGCDVLFHLAAKAGVRPSIADPEGFMATNVTGTQRVLEAARRYRVPQVIFASSSSVYGTNPRVPWSEDDAVLRPISPYAGSKVSAELLGHIYSHLYGIRFIALRFFTVYGPRQRPDLAIHTFTRALLRDEPIPCYGDGTTRRDYTYVSDVVDGIMAAAAYTGDGYSIFNLGNDRTVTLNKLVERLAAALGVTPRIKRLPEQAGDVPQTWANLEKSRRLLGYAPQIGLEEGLTRFATWFRAMPAQPPTA